VALRYAHGALDEGRSFTITGARRQLLSPAAGPLIAPPLPTEISPHRVFQYRPFTAADQPLCRRLFPEVAA